MREIVEEKDRDFERNAVLDEVGGGLIGVPAVFDHRGKILRQPRGWYKSPVRGCRMGA